MNVTFAAEGYKDVKGTPSPILNGTSYRIDGVRMVETGSGTVVVADLFYRSEDGYGADYSGNDFHAIGRLKAGSVEAGRIEVEPIGKDEVAALRAELEGENGTGGRPVLGFPWYSFLKDPLEDGQ